MQAFAIAYRFDAIALMGEAAETLFFVIGEPPHDTGRNTMKRVGSTIPQANRSALSVIAFLSLAALSCTASAVDRNLAVSATVLKHASMQMVSQPGSVSVTAADIARGYVDVPAMAQVMVRSNTRAGYLLMFASQGGFFRQALVRGLGNDVQLGPEGGGIQQKTAGRGMTRTELNLGFRFILSASAQQGVYAWPVRMSVTPL